jgi:predicted AlkP superfamily phosphohydrolase/phosphomutase
MKICVIGLDSATPEVVFQDERLTNLRRLMDAGLFGLLQGPVLPESSSGWQRMLTSQDQVSVDAPSIWQYLGHQGKKTVVLEFPAKAENGLGSPEVSLPEQLLDSSRTQWQEAIRSVTSEEWDGFQFVDFGLSCIQAGNLGDAVSLEYYLWLDEQIGAVMETMDDQTILLVVSTGAPAGQPGFFLLAAPNCPLSGEHEGATVLDIAPTLLDLAGYEIPVSMQGRSLVAGMEKLVPGNEDHEKIIYDRLAGLGYV